MKKYFLTALMTAASLMLLSSAGYAATDDRAVSDDGFGGSTYFTAQTPDALGDKPTGNALAASGAASSGPGMDNDGAEAVSKIEPAAGGDNYGVFTLPEDPGTPAHSGETLSPPGTPIVPGQTVNKTAQ